MPPDPSSFVSTNRWMRDTVSTQKANMRPYVAVRCAKKTCGTAPNAQNVHVSVQMVGSLAPVNPVFIEQCVDGCGQKLVTIVTCITSAA